MAPVDSHPSNVVTLRPSTAIAREKARAETLSVEQALNDNGEQFDTLIKRAARTAMSSGSHIFAALNETLAAAERASAEAQERLQLATTLFAKQLDVLDQAKSEHDNFVVKVQAESDASFDHQRDLKQAKQIGNEILAVKNHLRLLSNRYQMRMNIIRTENPLAWALYKHRDGTQGIAPRTLASKLVGNVADWLRDTKPFKKTTFPVARIDGQIGDANQNLARLNVDLNAVHDKIFRVRNENLQRISKNHQAVENAQKGFSAAQSLKETVAHEMTISKQTLASLQAWDHPVAKEALDQFTDIVMTASRTGENIDAVVFLMGSKQLANVLVADIKRSDLAHYDLIAELHYCEEAEAMVQTRPAVAAGVK
jgi:hypothetical protein